LRGRYRVAVPDSAYAITKPGIRKAFLPNDFELRDRNRRQQVRRLYLCATSATECACVTTLINRKMTSALFEGFPAAPFRLSWRLVGHAGFGGALMLVEMPRWLAVNRHGPVGWRQQSAAKPVTAVQV
jgi:hypothetical protein